MSDSLNNNYIVPLNDSDRETKLPLENTAAQPATNNTENLVSTNLPQDSLENEISANPNTEAPVQENIQEAPLEIKSENPPKTVKKRAKRVSSSNLMAQLLSANTEIQEILLKNKTKRFSVKIQDSITKKFYRIHVSLASY